MPLGEVLVEKRELLALQIFAALSSFVMYACATLGESNAFDYLGIGTAFPLEDYENATDAGERGRVYGSDPFMIADSDNEANETDAMRADRELTLQLYYYGVPTMVILCLVSMTINIKILVCIHWIKRPVSPTLLLTLSLAGADAYASACIALGLIVNSWLPALGIVSKQAVCALLVLEACRLGGIIMTVMHLLALACNHYLGILRPLHYASTMTSRVTSAVLVILWVTPTSFFIIVFFCIEGDGFRVENCAYELLKNSQFRLLFSSLFVAPFIVMVFIYSHIFIIVRRHQTNRLRFSRAGSMNRSAGTTARQQEQQMQRNLKAVYTTLLILGSYVLCWIPGIIQFNLMCNDCIYHFNDLLSSTKFYIYFFVNSIIILKALLNPIIYASRMNEIKAANTRMHSAIRNILFCRGIDELNDRYYTNSSTASPNRHSMCSVRGRSQYRHSPCPQRDGTVRTRYNFRRDSAASSESATTRL